MKAIQQAAKFNPVTITIETEDEMQYLKDMIENYALTSRFSNYKDFAQNMLSLVKDMK